MIAVLISVVLIGIIFLFGWVLDHASARSYRGTLIEQTEEFQAAYGKILSIDRNKSDVL